MSRYIPPEEMSEAQIREQLDAEYKHWDDLKKNGCSDPAWPDGVNLNLVRNHIIYWYRLLRERTSPDRAALDVRRWYGFEERAAVAAGSPGQVHGSDREVPRPSERQVGWPDF